MLSYCTSAQNVVLSFGYLSLFREALLSRWVGLMLESNKLKIIDVKTKTWRYDLHLHLPPRAAFEALEKGNKQ